MWRQLRLETRCLTAREGTVSAGVGLLSVCACRKLWECGTSGFGGRRSARQARWGAGAPGARRDFSWQVERVQYALKMLYDGMTVSAPRALCAAGVFVACGLGAVFDLSLRLAFARSQALWPKTAASATFFSLVLVDRGLIGGR